MNIYTFSLGGKSQHFEEVNSLEFYKIYYNTIQNFIGYFEELGRLNLKFTQI